MNNGDIMVSVSMITYNHEAFIAQAIEGVLMQRTDFRFELVIGEDKSTDKTREICLAYQQKYPDIIRLRLREKNVGMQLNAKETDIACLGKYIAYCEGDDYWTDPLKLQKQVTFLEKNPSFSLCCHRYKIYDQKKDEWLPDYGHQLFSDDTPGIEFDNGLNIYIWLTKTMTLVYRRNSFDPDILKRYKYSRDFHFCYHLLKNGKGYCFNFIGAIYRKHSGGVQSSTSAEQQLEVKYRMLRELYAFNDDDKILRNGFRKHTVDFIYWNLNSIVKRKSHKSFKRLAGIYKAEYRSGGIVKCFISTTGVVLKIGRTFYFKCKSYFSLH